jgi:hypothetical protein
VREQIAETRECLLLAPLATAPYRKIPGEGHGILDWPEKPLPSKMGSSNWRADLPQNSRSLKTRV